MMCLTIPQPWASLLTAGITRFEPRCQWAGHRGPVLIHAGLDFPRENRVLCRTPSFSRLLRQIGCHYPADLPTQALLGTAVLVDCVPAAEPDPRAVADADRLRLLQAPPDGWVLVFRDARPLSRPVFWKGSPGF